MTDKLRFNWIECLAPSHWVASVHILDFEANNLLLPSMWACLEFVHLSITGLLRMIHSCMITDTCILCQLEVTQSMIGGICNILGTRVLF